MPRVATQDMTSSLSLRSAGSIVDCGTDPIGTGDVTVMGWMKLYSYGGGASGKIIDNGKLSIRVSASGVACTSDNFVTASGSGINGALRNVYQHLAITRDSLGKVSFYIMSTLSGAPGQNSGTPASATSNLYIGNFAALTRNLDGLLKNWAIVNRICTQSEIQAHMNGITPSDATRIFKMNEGAGSTLYDSSANAVNGTITSGTWVTDTPSKLRTAATNRVAVQNKNCTIFHNATGGVTIPSNALTLPIGDATHTTYSWGCRVKISPKTGAAVPFFAKASTKYPLQFRVETNGKVRMAMYDGTLNPVIQTTSTVADNAWHTFIGRRLDNTLIFYVDGVYIGTTTAALGDMNEASTIVINGNAAIATMSDAWFTYNALTQEDATNYHKSGAIPYPCLFRLPFDEGAGQIAYDSSGNGNNGTITSGTWSADVPSKKRGVVGGNMVPNGDMSFVPRVNAPQTSGYAWLDGTSSGSGSNSLFCFAMFNYTSSYAAKFDTTEKYNGNNSLKLSTTGVASTIGVGTNLGDAGSHAKNNIPCLPNTSYTMTFYMKTNLVSGSAATGVLGRIVMCTGSGIGSAGASIAVGGVTTTTDWTKYTATILTSATARFLKTEFSIVGNDGAATLIMDAWFADIQLRPTVASGRETVV